MGTKKTKNIKRKGIYHILELGGDIGATTGSDTLDKKINDLIKKNKMKTKDLDNPNSMIRHWGTGPNNQKSFKAKKKP
tara:strand:+ start:2329 stop:2562 length:234 start_codon:yes stop_codon:yes gene_type:complete